MDVGVADKTTAVAVGQNEAGLLGKDAAGKRRLDGEVQLVAIGLVFRPFLIGPEVGNTGLDFDNGDCSVGGKPDDIGAAAVGEREFGYGCDGVGREKPRHAALDVAGNDQGFVELGLVHNSCPQNLLRTADWPAVGHAIATSRWEAAGYTIQFNAGWRRVFRFLQRLDKSLASGGGQQPDAQFKAVDTQAQVEPAAKGVDASLAAPFGGKTSSDFEPRARVLGLEAARGKLARLERSKPCSMYFIAAPRTSGHAKAIMDLLAEQAGAFGASEGLAVVSAFDAVGAEPSGGLQVLRAPVDVAKRLSTGVAELVEMLGVTLPAAFDSDSYKVARVSLEEELRSGHDGAIDALKRKAQAQNIGILRTPQGYAVAPMHEGRVVSPDVFKALPEGLRADVDAKLSVFENELSGVLSNRTTLQHDFWVRLRELDREVAGLTVRAAIGLLPAEFAKYPQVTAFLVAMKEDLTANAALFVAAARRAQGHARAPVEVAADPRFARYRVHVLSRTGDDRGVCVPQGLDRAILCGVVGNGGGPWARASNAAAVRAGALVTAGSGFVLIEARELLRNRHAWPILKAAYKTGFASPVTGALDQVSSVALQISSRLAVTGEVEDYLAWRKMDPDVNRVVGFISAFEPQVALTPTIEQDFAGIVRALIKEAGLQPLDGAGMAALMHERTDTNYGTPQLSADLDGLDEVLEFADQTAKVRGHAMTEAADILAALKMRADTLGLLAHHGGVAGRSETAT